MGDEIDIDPGEATAGVNKTGDSDPSVEGDVGDLRPAADMSWMGVSVVSDRRPRRDRFSIPPLIREVYALAMTSDSSFDGVEKSDLVE